MADGLVPLTRPVAVVVEQGQEAVEGRAGGRGQGQFGSPWTWNAAQ
jgi:hypothetical protein